MQVFLRPKGPAICIAQANGLGTQITERRLGPTAQPFVTTINPEHTVHLSRSHAFDTTIETHLEMFALRDVGIEIDERYVWD